MTVCVSYPVSFIRTTITSVTKENGKSARIRNSHGKTDFPDWSRRNAVKNTTVTAKGDFLQFKPPKLLLGKRCRDDHYRELLRISLPFPTVNNIGIHVRQRYCKLPLYFNF